MDVVIWCTATGGGHLSVARALGDAISATSGLSVSIEDPLSSRSAVALRPFAAAYGPLIRSCPSVWGALYSATSPGPVLAAMENPVRGLLAPAVNSITRSRRPRLVVSCHPLMGPAARAAAARLPHRPPLATVITDLAGGHPTWLSARPELILTATASATSWCLEQGVQPSRVRQVGLPVGFPFQQPPLTPAERAGLRRELGLKPEGLCVVLGGGGEGAGPLLSQVRAISESGLDLQLVVLCGRNLRLLRQLREQPSPEALVALGYTERIADWLRAADVYCGKAGPSSVAEAACSGVAIVLTGALPGQESSNPAELTSNGAAVVADTAAGLVRSLSWLLHTPAALQRLQEAALAWSRPRAAQDAASELLTLL